MRPIDTIRALAEHNWDGLCILMVPKYSSRIYLGPLSTDTGIETYVNMQKWLIYQFVPKQLLE